MKLWLAALVPLALTAAVYAPVGRFDFVELDDPYYVYNNPALAGARGGAAVRYALTTFTGGNWHPLVWLSYFADRDLWELRPGPMHVENAALHAASGVLVLLLLSAATGSVGRATVCAAVFAVHPVHVESVAWVSERKDALSTVWLLAAAYAYVRYAGPVGRPACGRRCSGGDDRRPQAGRLNGGGWYAALLACYGLSLSAKSMGATLPAVLLLLDAWPLGRLRGAVGRRVVEKLPLLAVAAAAAAVAVVAQRSVGATGAVATTAADRAGNAAVAVVRYVGDLFWPAGLAAFYPFRPVPAAAAAASAALLVAVTTVAVRARRRRPYLLVGWLWFAGTLVPVSGLLVQIGSQARADRYAYFPSVGLSVAVVWLAADVAGRRFGVVLATAAVAALSVAGRRQVDTWRDNPTLFARAAAVTDDNYLALDELGREAIRRGDLTGARRELDGAIAARADFGPAYADRGRCYLMAGRPAEASADFGRAVRLAPGVAAYRAGWAAALDADGRRDEAARVRAGR